ncbi:hypothetical protein MRX96_000555 [Rhipicephalus microplus]
MESCPPRTLPRGYFSAIDDVPFCDADSRPPRCSVGVTSEQRYLEGSPSAQFALLAFWVTLSLSIALFVGGVVIACLAYARSIDFEDRHIGVLMIQLAIVFAMAPVAFGVFRTCERNRSLPV